MNTLLHFTEWTLYLQSGKTSDLEFFFLSNREIKITVSDLLVLT